MSEHEWECDGCGSVFMLKVKDEDWFAHMEDLCNHARRVPIQDRFPYLKPWERELLRDPLFGGGLCEECFKKQFGG